MNEATENHTMKNKLHRWVSAILCAFACAFIPSGELWAQPAPAAANDIDQLTGPIALYPDALVIQTLTASKDYAAVLSFAGWLEKNASLKGSELQDAAQKAGFSEPLVALALFPQVIQMMVQKPDWTKALGQAVTADKKAVSDSVQRLRGQAQALGNLKTTPQQVVVVTNVIVERTVQQQVVVVTNTIVQIQPANPQVIYVPTYPQTVYVQQAPPPSSTSVAGAALLGFTVGVLVGANNSHYHNHYDDYWEDRQDYARSNQDQRQGNSQERQGERQGNQDQRQSNAQANQGQRQSGAASTQSQGAAGGAARNNAGTTSTWGGGPTASQSQRASTAAPASRSGGQTASRSTGMSSGGFSSYQSGGATKSQSSRGSSSLSSSRGGGGRSGGGRGR